MRVLITGANGMVGKNIVDRAPKIIELLTPQKKELNLLLFDKVNSYLKETNPDMIIHAAGIVGGIQANIANQVKFLVDNIEIGKNIIIAAKQNNIKKLLNVTSSCMYPRNAQNPLKEEAILTGELEPTNEGYAIAKIFSQRLCSYIVSEDTSFMYKTIIPCNLYGKWDKFDENNSHMIPAVIKKVYNAKKNNTNVEIWGSGKARREFMYASDFAEFIWYGVNNFNKMPFLMNVGLGKDYTINEYYNVISKVIGFNGKFINNTSKPEGMKQKLVDISKQIEFGWMPKYSLEEGIKETYKYFLENVNN